MEGSNSPFSLLCQENESFFSEHEEEEEEKNSMIELDAEFIQKLMERETNSSSSKSILHQSQSSRLEIINWILNTRELFGFQIQTALLSITYFDQFLSRRIIDDGKIWAFRLLAVACLSIAAKMEECKVPALSEFRIDDYNFASNAIQKMELFVLSTLEWKMGAITPFSYVHYFGNIFCDDVKPKELVSKAIELIFSITKEINLMDRRPSIIAAAAALAASDDRLSYKTMELKLNLITAFGSSEKQQVYSLYKLLGELENRKSNTPKTMISPDFIRTQPSSIGIFEKATIAKRKLVYNDQHCPIQKIYRPSLI